MSKTYIHSVIKPNRGLKLIPVKELIRYKDLFYLFVKRDITVLYKQTILGFMWAIINPLFLMVIFTVVFGNLAGVPSDNIPYPIFNYTALLPWTYFSQALSGSTNSLVQSTAIFTKVYFPRVIIPLTPVFSKLVDFAIAFLLLVGMMFYYGIYPNINIVFLPFLIVLMILTASGLGMWLSALAIQYRDIKFALPFLIQALLFLGPIVYPASLVRQKSELLYTLYGLYPMAGVIEGFRASLLGVNAMPWDLIGIGALSSVIIFLSGTLYFRRTENVFADVA
jgi:lipopolysaccharide transport system permease protein